MEGKLLINSECVSYSKVLPRFLPKNTIKLNDIDLH